MFNLKDNFFFSHFFLLDSSSMFMFCISPLVSFLIVRIIFIFGSLDESLIYKFNFNFLVLSVGLTFLVRDCLSFLILLEITVFPMAFIIFSFSKDLDKLSSILFIMFINLLGSIPFMIFIWIFYSNMGRFFFNFGLYLNLCDKIFLCFCFFLVFISKLPFFLFHFWLTKAHVRASGSCSMLLASLMLKLGSFGLLKFSSIFFLLRKKFFPLVFSISLGGSILLSLVIIRFFDIKFLVACSSVLHMSTIFPFLIFGHICGKVSRLLIITGHGLVSYFLFFCVTLLYERRFNRSFDFNKSMESLNKFVSMFLFIFVFLNLGVPPFINFLREVYSFSVLLCFSYFSLGIFLVGITLSIIFVMMMITKILFGKKILFVNQDLSNFFNFNSILFIMFLFLLPFLRYFFSLTEFHFVVVRV